MKAMDGTKRSKKGYRELPRFCHWATTRHGKKVIRFQRKGFSAYIHSAPDSQDFFADYSACLNRQKPSDNNRVHKEKVEPGTINKLIERYYKLAKFQDLAKSTQAVFRGDLERFRKIYGTQEVSKLKRIHINDIVGGMADRPQAANNLLKRLKPVLEEAIDLGWLKINPVIGASSFRKKTDGFKTWTSSEMDQYEDFHKSGTTARLAYALAYYTTNRRSDVAMLGKQHVHTEDGKKRMKYKQTKTGQRMDVIIHPALLKEIDLITHNELTFVLTSHGRPFSVAGLGKWFRDQCNAAGLPKVSMHGLRKSAAKAMIDKGSTTAEAAGMTGHQTLAEIDHYAQERDNKLLADRAVSNLTRNRK